METDLVTMDISADNPHERPPIQSYRGGVEHIVAPSDYPQKTSHTQNEAMNGALSTKSDKEPLLICQTDNCNLNIPSSRFNTHVTLNHMKKPKHAGGRPCGFCERKEEILKLTRSYLDSGKGDKPRMLYLNELAMNLGVYRDIVLDWKDKRTIDDALEHPEFHRMVKELESMQEFRLQQRLMGRFNPTGAIFLLKTKHKYIETEKQILAGDKSEAIQIEFVSERKLNE